MDDDELIANVASGDDTALRQLFDRARAVAGCPAAQCSAVGRRGGRAAGDVPRGLEERRNLPAARRAQRMALGDRPEPGGPPAQAARPADRAAAGRHRPNQRPGRSARRTTAAPGSAPPWCSRPASPPSPCAAPAPASPTTGDYLRVSSSVSKARAAAEGRRVPEVATRIRQFSAAESTRTRATPACPDRPAAADAGTKATPSPWL